MLLKKITASLVSAAFIITGSGYLSIEAAAQMRAQTAAGSGVVVPIVPASRLSRATGNGLSSPDGSVIGLQSALATPDAAPPLTPVAATAAVPLLDLDSRQLRPISGGEQGPLAVAAPAPPPPAAPDAQKRLSVDKATQFVERIRAALYRNGIETFYVVGGSAVALLEAEDKGEVIFRDFDIAVVANNAESWALASRLSHSVAEELGGDFDSADIQERPRARQTKAGVEKYIAGHGGFIDSSLGLVDLSVFRLPEDLARNGLFSWDRIRIPVAAGFHLPAFIAALHRDGYEQQRTSGHIEDPHAGWADLKSGAVRFLNLVALKAEPHLTALRLLNQLDKRGFALSADLKTLLTQQFPARAPPELGWLVHNLDKVTRSNRAAAMLKMLATIGFFAGWADPLSGFLERASTDAVNRTLAQAARLALPRFEKLAALLQASTPATERSWFMQGVLDFSPRLYRKMLSIAPSQPELIASLGPSSADVESIRGLILAGTTWLRVNLAHMDIEDTAALTRNVDQALAQTAGGDRVRRLFDLPGGKIRTGPAPEDKSVVLREGSLFNLRYGGPERPSQTDEATVDYENLAPYAKVGGTVLLHQGKIELLITAVAPGRIETRVVRGGTLRGHATVDLLGGDPAFPRLREEDRRKIKIAVENRADYIGVSMVQRPDQMTAVREELKRLSASHVQIVSKIETLSALENIDAIVERSDVVMIAGGDLATAVGSEAALRTAELKIADAAARHGKPLIAATGYEGPDAPAKVSRAMRLNAGFILLKGTAIEPEPIAIVRRLDAIIRGLSRDSDPSQ